MNAKTPKERLLKFLNFYDIAISSFYQTTQLPKNFLNPDQLRKPFSDILLGKILIAYPQLNPYWLLTGEGCMQCNETTKTATPTVPATKYLPLLEMHQLAAWNQLEGFNNLEKYPKRYQIPDIENIAVQFLVPLLGTAMYPKYNTGDILLCESPIVKDFLFQWGRNYVLNTTQGVLVRQIKKTKTKNTILCVSENKDFKDFELRIGEIYFIALVKGCIQIA